MSAAVRAEAERQRRRYARLHDVPVESVEVREFVNDRDRDDAEISVPTRPDLPRWTLG